MSLSAMGNHHDECRRHPLNLMPAVLAPIGRWSIERNGAEARQQSLTVCLEYNNKCQTTSVNCRSRLFYEVSSFEGSLNRPIESSVHAVANDGKPHSLATTAKECTRNSRQTDAVSQRIDHSRSYLLPEVGIPYVNIDLVL